MDILSTSTINSLISTYRTNAVNKTIMPWVNRKDKYVNISSAYDSLTTKLNNLKTELTSLSQTGTDSYFNLKAASSSNTNFLSASGTAAALSGSYEVRINQLAKKDSVISTSLLSSDVNVLSGTHNFKITSGDGEGGEFTSNIEVEFSGAETNKTAIEKIQSAINADKAVVKSDYKTGTDNYAGGASTFTINLNGTETIITVDDTALTYSEMMDALVESVNSEIDGVTAVKEEDTSNPGMFRISLTVDDSSKYISISSDTGYDIVSDLNIAVTQEKGAAGIVTASSFSPIQDYTQLSIIAKESGLGYRINDISDVSTFSALSSFGLNLGSARPEFVQTTNTPGFIYADITAADNLLNSKFNFNGVDIQKNSNSITDIADGLTLNFKSAMSATDTTVNVDVTNDTASIKTKIENFIKKFNDVYSYVRTSGSYTSGSRGILYGDSNAQALLSKLTSTAYSEVPGLDTDTLNKIGISFNASTGLQLSNATLFENKIKDDAELVASLFNSDDGIANNLLTFIEPYLGSGGYLATRKSSLESNIKSAKDKIKSVEIRIDKSAEMLRRRYEQLQVQLATLLSSQSFFSGDSSSYF